jgi:hypothetical protein
MASGDLNRIESAFAEATLDSGLWSRALNPTEIGSFGTARLPLGGVTIPGALFPGWVVWLVRADVWSGWWVAPGDALLSAIARRLACEIMPFDVHPRCKKVRAIM